MATAKTAFKTSASRAPATKKNEVPKTQTATFAAGCFWSVQETYRTTPGVLESRAGYCGGHVANPTYEQICTDETGHAEAVQVVFDPRKVSYRHLVDLFWTLHDPTVLNRQGLNFGKHYRSMIFFHSTEQKKQADASRKEAQKRFARPIVTEIARAMPFYPAEAYHQDFFMKRNRKFCGIF
ncbi:MAG: peptide-methionine (S)-S-oxide reductase MsrA [Candidatus Micrarchaeota archaeon]|nr:peptide-methionine (S)-S-oxide reductase MsrA [Candidatus Micrarchaeota archaeon]